MKVVSYHVKYKLCENTFIQQCTFYIYIKSYSKKKKQQILFYYTNIYIVYKLRTQITFN